MTLRDELVEYATRSETLIAESPQMDEENTKRKIIEPLIDLLGWDILSSEIELEYSIQMGSGTKRVDYALKTEGTPVVFIEAKGCDTSLEESHENQLKSYMRQVGVDWGLLSNGRRFEIFRRDTASNRPNEISLAAFAIEDISANEQPLSALARHAIESGESRRIAEKIEAVQNAVVSIRQNKEQLAEDITGVVTRTAGSAVSQQVEDETKRFVDELIETLADHAHRTANEHEPAERNDEPTKGSYEIRLTSNGTEVYRVADELQSAAVGALVNYLITEEGLLELIEIPYVPGTGRGTRALLNDTPTHTNGTAMRTYQQVGEQYYLHTNLPSDQKQRYISELAEQGGFNCEFIGEW